jgi:hypothetical protein
VRDLTAGAPVRVVVNRMRPTLGWSERDIAGMVEGFTRLRGLHFLPEDRATVDRALVTGRTFAGQQDAPLARAVAAVVDAIAPESVAAATRGSRRGRVSRRAVAG